MVTDGQVHDVPAEAGASPASAPLHGLLTAVAQRARPPRRDRTAPRFGIVGKEQTIQFRVDEVNGENAPVDVTVRFGNAPTANPLRHAGRSRTS